MDLVPYNNIPFLLACAAVRIGRAVGNAVQRIPQHVAEHNAQHFSRGAGLGEAPRLHAAEAFTYFVQLHNIGAAVEQIHSDLLQFFPGDKRQLEKGAAASGHQKDHCVFRFQIFYQFQRFFRRGKTVFIRNGMACFTAFHPGDVPLHMFIFGNDDTSVHFPQSIHRRLCHLPGRLADGHQNFPAAAELIILQCMFHCFVGHHCLQRLGNNCFRIFSQFSVHPVPLFHPCKNLLQNKISCSYLRRRFFVTVAALTALQIFLVKIRNAPQHIPEVFKNNSYSFGPATTSFLPSALPSYLWKFLMNRSARSLAFASHSAGSL